MAAHVTAEEERVGVQKAFDAATPMKANETWYVVSARWFNSWKAYTKFADALSPSSSPSSSSSSASPESAGRPGPIDNGDIIAK
jgi:hypothetical protein